MNAPILQPSLPVRHPSFSGAGLYWPYAHPSRILLQLTSPFPATVRQIQEQTLSNRHSGLAEAESEWAKTILKSSVTSRPKLSVLDMPPLDLGRVLRPLNERDDLLEEMLDDTRF